MLEKRVPYSQRYLFNASLSLTLTITLTLLTLTVTVRATLALPTLLTLPTLILGTGRPTVVNMAPAFQGLPNVNMNKYD